MIFDEFLIVKIFFYWEKKYSIVLSYCLEYIGIMDVTF